MSDSAASTLARYGIAIGAIAAAITLRYALTPVLGTTFPLATMFTAVAFVVWRVGAGPAVFTAIAGWFVSGFVFRGGINYFGGLTVPEFVGFLLYLLATLPIIVLGQSMRAAQRALEARHAELSTSNRELEDKVEAQALLAAIVASSDDAIISKTLDGIITSWNRGAEQLFGWRHDEAIGQSIHLIVPPELRDQERDILERLRRGEHIQHLDVERVRKDGSRVHISVTISPVRDRHGHIIGASKTARDITIRKTWERELVRGEEAQRLLVGIHDATRGLEDPARVMREIVTRVGVHFDVIRCAYGEIDESMQTLLVARGYTKGVPTVAGRYPLETFGPLLTGELKAGRTVIIDDVRRDPLTDAPRAHQTFEAMQIVSMIVVPLLRGGRLVAILMMASDQERHWSQDQAHLLEEVAERTLFVVDSARAAQALREHSDTLKLAMSTAPMGAWSRDLVSNRVWMSPELATIFGVSETAPYNPEQMFALAIPEDRARLANAVAQAIATRGEYSVEFRFRHAATGELHWMESRCRIEYGSDGQPAMLYGLGIDITARKEAVAALQEADRRKDEFLATLAHELRNPLAPIKASLQILASAANPSQAKTAIEIMERQVSHMVRLVDDLLDVARITTGKVEIRSESIDLATAITDAIETSKPFADQRGQALIVTPPAAPVYVSADRTRLAQVFANLLNNSAKYSEPGQPITLAFGRDGNDAVVRVRDMGIGIHPEMIPRVFEMFRQADRTGGRSRGGLGIGLSLVKRILEMHGGTVTATSQGLGQGSEFMVRLPAVEAPRALAEEPAPAVNDSRRRRILVVDDNEDAAESLAALLAIGGHDTRMAHDGPDALREAERFKPDVVFLDIGMPTLDGHETAKLIRRQPWGRSMVLIALTGWGQTEDRRRSKDAGFNHHLVKPADPTMVTNLLASLDS